MSDKKSKIVFITIKIPDGKEHQVPLPEKTFSSGREGVYSQILPMVDDEMYGGQIQIWNKSKTVEK